MEKKFTKGEWKVDASIEHEVSVVSPWCDKVRAGDENTFGDYRGAIICTMNYVSATAVPTKEKALANAKLIAVAPKLLENAETNLSTFHSLIFELKRGRVDYAIDTLNLIIKDTESEIKKATE